MHLGFVLRVLCVIHVVWIGTAAATKIGVIYGDEAALAAGGAENAVQLLRAQGVNKVRLYDADSAMLRALGGSSIEVLVGLRDDELVDVGVSKTSAHSWVARNVAAYLPDTKITAIAVGNEILTNKDESLVPFLVPAMRNIHSALAAAGLDQKIKVSTPQSLRLLSTFSPPSAATFDSSLSTRFLSPVLDFLSNTGSFFMLNLNPFDVQQANPSDLSLGHALYSTSSGIDDHVTGLHYSNRFEALVDAVFVAMASLNHPELDIVVTEAGWSRDSSNYDAAALTFHADLLKHVASGYGTPFKPRKVPIDTYMEGRILSSIFKSHAGSEFIVDTVSSSVVDTGVRRKLLADKTWCVARDGARTEDLQAALDWACGPGGANCQPIQAGQFCFLPNTMQSHASYAFNSYYQQLSWAAGSCDFGGLAQITSNDPSYTGCLYPSTGSDPTNSTNNTSGAQTPRHQFSLAWLALILLVTWRLTVPL